MRKRKFYLIPALIAIVSLWCCEGSKRETHQSETTISSAVSKKSEIDLQGHRGARGLMPENTIPGFIRALDLGVNTLEMDVVITRDKQVILSHEPWFSHEIALTPIGEEIAESDERTHAIYKMDFTDAQKYDVGSKTHPRFPDQEKFIVAKPLLAAVIDSAEAHARKTGRPLPFYNIETKSHPEGDGIFHPKPDEFARLLVEVIEEKEISDRAIIQSFDPRTLQYIHNKYPEITLAWLIENSQSPAQNLETLGFTPDIYSPLYTLVDEDLVRFCKSKQMKLIPWTVNETREMENLVELGVDGIITDYPDRFERNSEKL